MSRECDTCYGAGVREGTCDHCIATGRHERLDRGRPQRQQARKPSRADIWFDKYVEVFSRPPRLPVALPPNASQQAVSQLATLTAMKGIIAIVEATGAVLRAA
jgi:hypothetical protein